jgi:hypothetical protein
MEPPYSKGLQIDQISPNKEAAEAQVKRHKRILGRRTG